MKFPLFLPYPVDNTIECEEDRTDSPFLEKISTPLWVTEVPHG